MSALEPLTFLLGRNAHGLYCIPQGAQTRPAPKTVLAGQVWEPHTIAFMARMAADGGDLIHAGTFFGDFLPALSHALLPGARVWAFEPNPESHQCAQITCLLNRLHNIDLMSAGLADKSGTALMKVSDGLRAMGGASRIRSREVSLENRTGHIEVPILTLDDVIPAHRRISVLQLDVEGYEKPALAGAIRTIERWKPAIVLESVPRDWVEAQLLPMGYSEIGKLHDNTVFATSPIPL